MLELLKYELKKIVMRKSARYTCLAVLVALCGIMALNVVQTKTTNNTGEVLSGFDASTTVRIRRRLTRERSPTSASRKSLKATTTSRSRRSAPKSSPR